MTLDSFYAIVSGTCFALVGLWWGVVQFNKDWLNHAETRALAGGIYLSFLIPGVMSLIAQVSGDNKIIWRATFVIAAALGIYFTARLIWNTRNSAGPVGPFRRHRWIVIVLYLLVLIFGAAPELAKPLNLQPLQVESILLSLLILIAHGLTWEFIRRVREEGYTILVVEQNVRQVLKLVDRAYLLEVGRIKMEGRAAELAEQDFVRKAYVGL